MGVTNLYKVYQKNLGIAREKCAEAEVGVLLHQVLDGSQLIYEG